MQCVMVLAMGEAVTQVVTQRYHIGAALTARQRYSLQAWAGRRSLSGGGEDIEVDGDVLVIRANRPDNAALCASDHGAHSELNLDPTPRPFEFVMRLTA